MISHKCEALEDSGLLIQYRRRFPGPDDGRKRWQLCRLVYDTCLGTDGEVYTVTFADIGFCPFCGKKLDPPDRGEKGIGSTGR